ncbi:MAG: type II toxin-antitoxin system Phd/YefM family antitoxin [Spirochaetes bacterium]|nr:type II toxin-antitoxin system Phd/YefM family antitoxin [Spirochaetota bacterium]
MKIKEDIRPVSYVKSHTADVLNQVNDTRRPTYVTQNGEARAVVVDSESYEQMKNALGLMKILSQSEDEIKKGEITDHKIVFSVLKEKLKNKK